MYRGGGMSYGGGGYYRYGYEDAAPVAAAPAVAYPTVYCFGGIKLYGTVLALLAAATLSLGIADVVLTREAYCNPWMGDAPVWCSSTKEPYIWVWVASGIWGSVPIFLAGLFAMCMHEYSHGWSRCFSLFIFLSAIVFAPGMAVLSAIECWRGHAADYTFYSLNSGVKEGNIMPDGDNPYQAKFALPLVIAILACIEFIMTAVATIQLCCCGHTLGVHLEANVGVTFGAPRPAPVQQEAFYAMRPQVRDVEVYQPVTYQPPVRYNPVGGVNVGGGAGIGVGYGGFPSRANFGGYFSGGAGAYGGGNPSYRWY